MRKFPSIRTVEHMPKPNPRVSIVCPACGSEVSFDEIIEKKGSIRCVNCLKR